MKNILSIFCLIIVVLVSFFLIWDAFENNGNIIWSKAYWIITFSQIPDQQWAEKYDVHPIVVAFKQKYNNTNLTQDLGYAGKYLDYTVSNSTDTPRLHIWIINDKRDHFYLKCEESFKSLPITVPMQVSDFDCDDKILNDTFLQKAYGTHDPNYNHVTPFPNYSEELESCKTASDACQESSICNNTVWHCSNNNNDGILAWTGTADGMETRLETGSAVDLDPDLSPSFAYDFAFGWNSIFVFVSLVSVIITAILLSIHFILKKKNIRSRPYITVISAAIMLYFGIQTLLGLGTILMFLQQESPWHYLDQIVALLSYPIIGFSLIGLGIIFLYKSQLIRRLIRK